MGVPINGRLVFVGIAGLNVVIKSDFDWTNYIFSFWFKVKGLPNLGLTLQDQLFVLVVEKAVDFVADLLTTSSKFAIDLDEVCLDFEVRLLRH